MVDHEHYSLKNSTPLKIALVEDDTQDKENNHNFDKNLISLLEFNTWVYDKEMRKDLDEESIYTGWKAIADALHSTGIYGKAISIKKQLLYYV